MTEQDVKNIIVNMFTTGELLVEIQKIPKEDWDGNRFYQKKFVVIHQSNGYKKVLVSRFL